ncbi:MAG: PAS domain S-box protein, partial [Nitrospirae bacterium]|nr:PAS domain S-box protein [Nitrospirota bacterium]
MKKQQIIIAIAILSIIFIATGFFYFKYEADRLIKHKHEDLKVISELKASQITKWFHERIGDAHTISNSPFMKRAFSQFIKNPENNELKNDISNRLNLAKRNWGYENILVVSTKNEVLLSLDPSCKEISPETIKKINQAFKEHKVLFTDFYFCSKHNRNHIDIIAPVLDKNNTIHIVFLIFRINPHDYIYPLIQLWPVPSETAETLLVEKEGDSVLFLNELRYKKDTALKLRIPLTEKQVPAVQAVSGYEGIFEGKDYRGIDVIADIKKIKDTPWYMVAKMDKKEIYSEVNHRAIIISAVTFLFILLIIIASSWFYYARQRDFYRQLFLKEKSLREVEEEFQIIIKSVGDAVITTDTKGNVRFINPVAEELTGWKYDDAKGRNIEEVFQIINEQTRKKAENPVQRVLREGLVVGIANHTLLVSKDGREIPIADSGAPIHDKEGIIGVVLVFRDQTEERAHQKALEQSEEQFRKLFEESPISLYIHDKDTGEIIDANMNAVKSYGMKTLEELKKNEFWLDPPYSFKEALAWIHKAEKEGPQRFEWCNRRITGEIFWEDVRLSKININGVDRILAATIDITDRKKKEEELRESEELFRKLFEEHAAVKLIIDPDTGNIVDANEAAEKFYGWSRQELKKMKIQQINTLPPEEVKNKMEEVRAQKNIRFEFKHRISDGSIKDVEVYSSKIVVKGKELLHSIIHDISDRKKLEAQLLQAQKMEAIGQLAGGIAHDFNNILSGMVGFAHILKIKMNEKDPLRIYPERILELTERAANLTQSLLAFSRKKILDIKPTDLNELLRSIDHILVRIIGEDIQFQTEISEEKLTVMADHVLIEQVLMNIATNARDAMPDGGVLTIKTEKAYIDEEFIKAHGFGKEGDYAVISVTDTGIGIDKEIIGRIFDPFFTTKEVGKGTGLGLAMAYGIIKQHNGYINVY